MKYIYLFFAILFLGISGYAQKIDSNPPPPNQKDIINEISKVDDVEVTNVPPTSAEVDAPEVMSIMTSYEFWLSFGVLFFGFLVMLIELYLMKTNKFDQNQTIKFVLVTLIITSALFLIAAGFSNSEIASAMGLLGTIAGYLLGKGDNTAMDKSGKS